MARFLCFTLLTSKKKKSSKKSAISADLKQAKTNENPRVKPEELLFEILPPDNTVEKLMPNADVTVETAYKGGDDNNKKHSMKRDLSDLDLQSNQNNSTWSGPNHPNQTTPEIPTPSSHQSEQGMVQEMSKDSSSPRLLKRSCSNIERKSAAWTNSKVNKSRSYGNLASLPDGAVPNEKGTDSPFSVKTSCTADRVMLKKRSSSQVLPSRSRKLWWRLFMWSHRNLHRTNWISSVRAPARAESVISDISNNNKGGYTSDTLETSEIVDKKKKKVIEDPSNQWMAFSTETTYLDRVSAWVNSIPNKEDEICEDENEELLGGNMDGEFFLPSLPEVGESSGKNHSHANKRRGGDEDLQANNVIQSLNFLSSVAHISGMALKVVPAISAFTSLKAVNLSSNFIVHIPSGALPKSLHTLDLSRNKIVAIEGLRELTRLRMLNLSYNRISRIGQGLSSCTAIKELYLAGNKISDVEGLHRLLKLTVLDLSFNKITMTKAIGQLVANYNSLLALNLLGNPIQSNIGDEQLKKAVSGLLPKVAYLNKQLIKPQRGREVTTDRVAKAALGNTGWDSRRKVARRVSQISGPGSLSRGGRSVAEGNSHRGKSRHRK